MKITRRAYAEMFGPTAGDRVRLADTVVTNALVIDWTGIVKCDIAVKDGRIARLGKAGNPDIQPGVDIVIGPGTEIIAHGIGADMQRDGVRKLLAV